MGGSAVASHFWSLLWEISVLLIPYTIAFRIFHTYSGVFRYSSFIDLARVALSMCLGSAAAYLVYLLFPLGKNAILEYPTQLVLLLFFSTTFMCAVRIIVKMMYDLFRYDGQGRRIFIYGTKDGGISLAKSIRNETASQYTLKGFISSDVEMSGKWLMGLPVYSEKEDVVKFMNRQKARTIMVSPMQTRHFREQIGRAHV